MGRSGSANRGDESPPPVGIPRFVCPRSAEVSRQRASGPPGSSSHAVFLGARGGHRPLRSTAWGCQHPYRGWRAHRMVIEVAATESVLGTAPPCSRNLKGGDGYEHSLTRG